MKKIILACVVILFAMTSKVMAQPNSDGTITGADLRPWSWTATKVDGPQTVQVPGGKGILKFDKHGDKFSNVRYINAAGKMRQFSPAQHPIPALSKIPCKISLPNGCFATADNSIGLCFCKTEEMSPVTRSGAVYTITFGGSFE